MRKNISKYLIILILIIGSFLRLWRLDKVPVSLFGDELDVGYHAYSILKTGQDYSGNFMPLHFQSLAEWRTPLYLYSAVPTVALFGISPYGVRLPAALFGILGIYAIYLMVREITRYVKTALGDKGKVAVNDEYIALISAFLLAVSPWHIQYSRAGFEVTLLLVLLLLAIYYFFCSIKSGCLLWLSVTFFCLTPLVYSTAKLFTPIFIIFLFLLFRKTIINYSKKYLVFAVIAGLVIGLPTVYSTLFGGGAQRFNYISVFTDPTIRAEVGVDRQQDARFRGEMGEGLTPNLADKLIHNKIVLWSDQIITNYFQPLSFDFLFIKGDLNLRHSIDKMGELYRIEVIPLLLGVVFFFGFYENKKIKKLILFWLLLAMVPAAITREGGRHATRLILMLPPLIFLISYGLVYTVLLLKKRLKTIAIGLYGLLFVVNFIFYQHNYWVHNPWDSERWWHAGYQEAIQSIKVLDSRYSKVIISMQGEPAWIFFAGWYQFPPAQWHQGFPFKKETLPGFGEISYIGKYYFGSLSGKETSIYDLPKYIDNQTLYLAVAKEVGNNLVINPEKTPTGLILVKSIKYPSGEPAFYLFTKAK